MQTSLRLLLTSTLAVIGCAKSTPPAPPPASTVPITTISTSWHPPLPPPETAGESAPASTEDGSPASAANATTPTSAAAFAACSLVTTLRDAGASPSGHRFVLTVKNTGSTPLRLVVPGDGSEAGWRTPTLTWTATSGGKRVAALPQARCGMMNRIEASEIFTLAPGASRDLNEWIAEPSFAKGTYDLRLTYRNDPGLAARGKGGESADVKRLLAGSSACEATSNALHVSL